MNALEVEGLSKRFGAVRANDGVTLAVEEGSIHGIVGENGAGKSTLVHILTGLYRPDSGSIRVFGREVLLRSPMDAIRAGIGAVYQDLMLVPTMSVADNVALGLEPRRGMVVDRAALRARVEELSRAYGLAVDPGAPVERLSVALRQRVEILKALFRKSRILILDEPTALLTPQETESLFEVLRKLRDGGLTILFVSHKLEEVVGLCNRVTVLRGGRVAGGVELPGATVRDLARLIVGRDVLLSRLETSRPPGAERLVVQGLTAAPVDGVRAFEDVNLTVGSGEIVSLLGVAGNGQSELLLALAGLWPVERGSIRLEGVDVTRLTPRSRQAAGLVTIPEDRLEQGLVLDFPVSYNLALGRHHRPPFAKGGLLDVRAVVQDARELVSRYDIRPPDPHRPVRLLSGGNQQRILLARAVAKRPRVLLCGQPTRGLDIAGMDFIRRQLIQLANDGVGVLLVTLSMEEAKALSHRILVMYRGRVVSQHPPDASEEVLGLYMLTGQGPER